ncbi:MAG TPA: hypothetical protein VGC54_11985 [Planctomycetota bacterium]
MNKSTTAILAFALLVALFGTITIRSQEPAVEKDNGVYLVLPQRTVYWDTAVVDDDLSARLLTVPEGQRFVLTDLSICSHEEFRNQHAHPNDRLWIEHRDARGRRRPVIDSLAGELASTTLAPGGFGILPLHWESGINYGPGAELWVNYRFGTDTHKNGTWVRRVQYSGYFEDLEPRLLRVENKN